MNLQQDRRTRSTDTPDNAEVVLLRREFDQHKGRFNAHVEETNKRLDSLLSAQETNTVSIDRLVSCTQELHQSTKDVVDLYKTGKNVVQFGTGFGRLIKWVAGAIAAVAVIYAWLAGSYEAVAQLLNQ